MKWIAICILALLSNTFGTSNAVQARRLPSLAWVFLTAHDLPQSARWACRSHSDLYGQQAQAGGSCAWKTDPFKTTPLSPTHIDHILAFAYNFPTHTEAMLSVQTAGGNWHPTHIGDRSWAVYSLTMHEIIFRRKTMRVQLMVYGRGVNPTLVAHLARIIDGHIVNHK